MKALLLVLLLALPSLAAEPDYSAAECPAYARVVAEHQARLLIVSAPWCPACRRLEALLSEEGIPVVVIDVDKYPRTAALFDAGKPIPRLYLLTGRGRVLRMTVERY